MSKKGQKYPSDSKSAMSSNGKASGAPASSVPPANAWSQPLRPKTNPPPPGMGGKVKSQNAPGGNNSNAAASNVQNALRERFIGLALNMVGQKVVVTQTNGSVFEGIFHTFSPFASLPAATKNKYVIKACRVIKPPQGPDAANQTKALDQSTVIISADKVACLTAKSMRIDALTGNNGGSQKSEDRFRTDAEISAGRTDKEKDLVAAGSAWTAAGTGNSRAEALMGGALGDDNDKGARRNQFNSAPNSKSSGLSGSIGGWDQFRANQELFNVKGNYDENLYTTELDKSQMDKKKIAEAERLAREIENTTSSNVHIAEERGHLMQGDYDEEDLYSGVLKDGAVKPAIASKTKSASESGDSQGKKADKQKVASSVPQKMNYAAAAAKADSGKKVAPPGFSSKTGQGKASTPEKKADNEASLVTPDDKEKTTAGEAVVKAEKTKIEENRANADESTSAITAKNADDGKTVAESSKNEKKGDASNTPIANEEIKSDSPAESAASKPASKLNANAKEFTLNPTAKTFTPGGGGNSTGPMPDGQYVDPNTAMHMAQVAPHMQAPHYMHAGPMGQPGMMPMMNPHFRYPAGYGVEQQHMAQMQSHQPQHMQATSSAHGSGAPSPGPGSEEGSAAQQTQQDGDASQQSQSSAQGYPQQPPQQGQIQQQQQQQQQQPGQQQQPQQQQQVPLPYGVPPPGAYYGGMAMHPRGPGGPHPGYHPQFVGGPQQMPVGPGGAPYRHMYPMQGGMPPNVQVRGPGGPYYGGPVGPVPYPPGPYVGHGGMMDDDQSFRGGRGSGRGRGGGRRGGRGGRGRGGRGYNNYHNNGRGQGGHNQNGAPQSSEGDWAPPDQNNGAGQAPQAAASATDGAQPAQGTEAKS